MTRTKDHGKLPVDFRHSRRILDSSFETLESLNDTRDYQYVMPEHDFREWNKVHENPFPTRRINHHEYKVCLQI